MLSPPPVDARPAVPVQEAPEPAAAAAAAPRLDVSPLTRSAAGAPASTEPQVLGKGTYGCVVAPSLPCEGDAAGAAESIVGKVFFGREYDTSNEEFDFEQRYVLPLDRDYKFHARFYNRCEVPHASLPATVKSGCLKGIPVGDPRRAQQVVYSQIRIQRGRPLDKVPYLSWPLDKLRDKLRPLIDGVFKLADAGVLHNDLKPANVVVNDSDDLLLIDWGMGTTPSHIATQQETITKEIRDLTRVGDIPKWLENILPCFSPSYALTPPERMMFVRHELRKRFGTYSALGLVTQPYQALCTSMKGTPFYEKLSSFLGTLTQTSRVTDEITELATYTSSTPFLQAQFQIGVFLMYTFLRQIQVYAMTTMVAKMAAPSPSLRYQTKEEWRVAYDRAWETVLGASSRK